MVLHCVYPLALNEGDLRLTFNYAQFGVLEIYHNGIWGHVCIRGFDLYEADLACVQLGYLYADRVATTEELLK